MVAAATVAAAASVYLSRDIFMEERIPCYYHYLSSHLAPGAIPGASRLIIVAAVAWVCPSASASEAEVVAWVCPSASASEAAAEAASVAASAVESAAELVLVSEPASAALTVAYTSRALQPSCHPAPRS